jgi:hypothetical protein
MGHFCLLLNSTRRKGPLFRNAILKTGKLSKERMSRRAVLYMVVSSRNNCEYGLIVQK